MVITLRLLIILQAKKLKKIKKAKHKQAKIQQAQDCMQRHFNKDYQSTKKMTKNDKKFQNNERRKLFKHATIQQKTT